MLSIGGPLPEREKEQMSGLEFSISPNKFTNQICHPFPGLDESMERGPKVKAKGLLPGGRKQLACATNIFPNKRLSGDTDPLMVYTGILSSMSVR